MNRHIFYGNEQHEKQIKFMLAGWKNTRNAINRHMNFVERREKKRIDWQKNYIYEFESEWKKTLSYRSFTWHMTSYACEICCDARLSLSLSLSSKADCICRPCPVCITIFNRNGLPFYNIFISSVSRSLSLVSLFHAFF